ncbi:LTA synthase family protein [Methylophaga sp.]|uniref:LTA synthase family protein n=1 Tax=Methylophaga sp. TaxID=2024840 RepID=UPI0014005CAE|nr:LTA synthase family protein [Methylophaga sp.]MTI63913.1 LTA synthase family protein [Methylophaga sp.]
MTKQTSFSYRFSGPYASLIRLLLVYLCILGLSRMLLTTWQYERLDGLQQFSVVMFNGLRVDLILSGMLLAPLVLLVPLLAHKFSWLLWQRIITIWAVLTVAIIVFMELASPTFIIEYGQRPNRLFIEYLKYPREVMSMLWEGYRLTLVGGVLITAAVAYGIFRLSRSWLVQKQPGWAYWKTLLCWPLMVLVTVVMIRSSFDHRPANPSSFAITPDPLVNDLMLNSAWSVYFAIYNLKHEEESNEVYGELSHEQILAEVHEEKPELIVDAMADPPIVNPQHATKQRKKPLNLVLILEESLSADYVKTLGGSGATPQLDKLSEQGWWFENLYATGTRSVRGIEAVISGFLPTRARSVVKLSLSQQNFFTIASLLENNGYLTEFIYGGQAHFDNMASFFMGNGFQHIIDREHFDKPVFEGSWGVSDEDVFNKLHDRLQRHHATGQPFFSFAFTSSNHSPYEFPDGRIEINGEKQTPENAVRYADYALGQFFEKAQRSEYWQDTIFLVVADHHNRVEGENLVPIEKYHIPGLILGADIEPRRLSTIASQIDLPTTVLSMMGISSSHPMIGRDLTLAEEQQKAGRAFMQYDDYFAKMTGEEVVILRPEATPLLGRYDHTSQQLHMRGSAESEPYETALAHALLPGWLYRCRCYHVPSGNVKFTQSEAMNLSVMPTPVLHERQEEIPGTGIVQ